MYGNNLRAPKVDVHKFSMIPRADIPRSKFKMQTQHKTTFNASYLIPTFIQEALPGDTWALSMTAFVRMSTPIFPIMDNMDLETWFFFVPNRILWTHWINFCGEQPSTPSDSISYVIPQIVSPAGGFTAGSPYDYLGLPTAGQITGANTTSVNALPLRAYNMIWNQWFRDENLNNAVGYGAANTVFDLGDGPDPYTNYTLLSPNKRHDYFTACLPWTQKGGVAITLPLSGTATVKTASVNTITGIQNPMNLLQATSGGAVTSNIALSGGTTSVLSMSTTATAGAYTGLYPSNLYADLTTATNATINSIRLAFQTQKLLERDARGGTRYQELLMSHFGVHPLDSRLQRPEYLGGGRTPVNIAPVPQTGGTGASGTSSPLGTLSAVGTAVSKRNGFKQSFTEHGYIIGLSAVRSDMIYQQGTRRMWTRSTRYDFYWPVFAMLGEQSVRQDEIYTLGTTADTTTFGYQERWAEYRYMPSMITGSFRSTYATPLDAWHLAQKFSSSPSLNANFIGDSTVVQLTRALAGGSAIQTNNEQFLADLYFDITVARPMPMYSVPGLIDHF